MALETAPYIDFHTHQRVGVGCEVLNVDALDAAAVEWACEAGLPFSVGVHPWRADATEEQLHDAYARIERCAQAGGFVAIGECGLDWVSNVVRETQIAVFEHQLELAKRLSVPVVLHCVRAFEEVMSTLRKVGAKQAVFHSFIGSAQQVERVVREGYLCSFSPRSLASSRTCEAIRSVDSSTILIESDESAEPIAAVYERVAELRCCSVEELRQIVFDNYKRLIDND